jgi:ABC-type ATPase with predicted acetyltransferase domain
LNRIPLPHRPVIELFPGLPLEKALELLSRVGLAEAHTYLLPPAKLSAGQRWRLRVALAIARPEMAVARHWAVGTGHCFCLVCDEFAAVLDRVTAAIVAHALRRVVDQGSGLCAILATSHDDVVRGLRPDWVVECEFGKVEVRRMRGNGGEGVCEGETKARPPRPMRF